MDSLDALVEVVLGSVAFGGVLALYRVIVSTFLCLTVI